jgi:hypothetical protein
MKNTKAVVRGVAPRFARRGRTTTRERKRPSTKARRLRSRVVILPPAPADGRRATPQFVSFVSFVREGSEKCWTER